MLAQTAGRTAGWGRAASNFAGRISSRQVNRAASSIADTSEAADKLRRSVESSRDDVARLRSDIREFGQGAGDFADSIEGQRVGVQNASKRVQESHKTVREARTGVLGVREAVEKVLPEDQ